MNLRKYCCGVPLLEKGNVRVYGFFRVCDGDEVYCIAACEHDGCENFVTHHALRVRYRRLDGSVKKLIRLRFKAKAVDVTIDVTDAFDSWIKTH